MSLLSYLWTENWTEHITVSEYREEGEGQGWTTQSQHNTFFSRPDQFSQTNLAHICLSVCFTLQRTA